MNDASLRSLIFQLCDINTVTGILTWKERPVEMFPTVRACRSWNSRFAGKEAGSTNKRGYREIQIGGRLHLRHRLIWLVEYGVMPILVDHEQGVEAGDGIGNLRATDQASNTKNAKRQTRNKSGHTGVEWYAPAGKWRATIRSDGQRIHLGHFDQLADAVAARQDAERLYGFHPNHGRSS
ncbi:HNH endonuclease [Gellertiella hungarica]|uniref:HNH endonuclease n=1 Tax=Gellertiella hungarica TaxID=1572859 RepID=A0A7W6J8L6_9HYPH|nr:HNH endonuclease [Gellertiella hungarica]MBB4066796.1 hypothetical protein [Gellertiella hungarica]